MPKNLALFLTLPIFLAFFSSCDMNDPALPSTEVVTVTTGSSFTYEEYYTDSTNAVIAASRHVSVSTVLRTDSVMAGKSGVVVVANVTGSAQDTSFYAYESNNNFSVLGTSPSTGDPTWFTLPVGTGSQSISTAAGSITNMGITIVVHDTITISLVGTEIMTVQNTTLSVKNLRHLFHEVIAINGQRYLDVTVENRIYYAPSLGMIAKSTTAPSPNPSGGWTHGTVKTLIAYVLK
ncbi:MAG: hypothetical protein WBQ23_10340 [Bacteroidota bacterium]